MKYDMFGPTKYVIKVSFICINHIVATDINNYCRIRIACFVASVAAPLLSLWLSLSLFRSQQSSRATLYFTHTDGIFQSYIVVVLFPFRKTKILGFAA